MPGEVRGAGDGRGGDRQEGPGLQHLLPSRQMHCGEREPFPRSQDVLKKKQNRIKVGNSMVIGVTMVKVVPGRRGRSTAPSREEME